MFDNCLFGAALIAGKVAQMSATIPTNCHLIHSMY